MVSRYNKIKTKKTNDGREVYVTKKYPNIPLQNSDTYIATETGDRLDTLANQFYGDSSLWWVIASANNIHDGAMGVDDGTILRIPQQYLKILNDFTNQSNG
jgi:nucleoid-associated protein YgaU